MCCAVLCCASHGPCWPLQVAPTLSDGVCRRLLPANVPACWGAVLLCAERLRDVGWPAAVCNLGGAAFTGLICSTALQQAATAIRDILRQQTPSNSNSAQKHLPGCVSPSSLCCSQQLGPLQLSMISDKVELVTALLACWHYPTLAVWHCGSGAA